MAKKIDNHILEILAASVCEASRLYLPAKISRADYVAVNAVLEANGGKWNKAAKAHVFDENAEDAIEQALATGEFHRVKQDLGQFDTPPAVVARLIELADIRPGDEVLEPSAGIGNIVEALIAANVLYVRANEIDEKRRNKMKERFDGMADRVGFGSADFLTVPPRPIFDRVVMNPPFAKQADVDHVRHALQFLRPGGRLVAIMSAAIMWRQNKKTTDFMEQLRAIDIDVSVELLNDGAFAESGTMVKACIVKVDV